MKKPYPFKEPEASQLAQHTAVLQSELRLLQQAIGAEALASQTGCKLHIESPEQGAFELTLWQQPVQILFPAWTAIDSNTGQALHVANQALLLYYFLSADGIAPESRWISFGDLPEGRFYNQAFQGYSGNELARAFQNDLEAFQEAATRLGGALLPATPEIPGDRSFIFQALPRVAVLTVYWMGDEDFPAAAQILFDATTPHYLPTDVCAILGGTLTRKLIKAKGSAASW